MSTSKRAAVNKWNEEMGFKSCKRTGPPVNSLESPYLFGIHFNHCIVEKTDDHIVEKPIRTDDGPCEDSLAWGVLVEQWFHKNFDCGKDIIDFFGEVDIIKYNDSFCNIFDKAFLNLNNGENWGLFTKGGLALKPVHKTRLMELYYLWGLAWCMSNNPEDIIDSP